MTPAATFARWEHFFATAAQGGCAGSARQQRKTVPGDTMTTVIDRNIAMDAISPTHAPDRGTAADHRPGAPFRSVLFERAQDLLEANVTDAPRCFPDLNLDQVIAVITAGREEYDLKPFLYSPLTDARAIQYRHRVMHDLEHADLFERVNAFALSMRNMRAELTRVQKLSYKEYRQAWFLEAVQNYCNTVAAFANDVRETDLASRGLVAFRDYLTAYVGSARFTSLLSETQALQKDLATVQYCVLINGDRFTVRTYESEPDYSVAVEETFEKFKQGAVTDYKVTFKSTDDMNHIEAKILEFVAKLHPEIFLALDRYCAKNTDFIDETIAAFDREIQFYCAYLDYTAALKRAGLPFCYPRIADAAKSVFDDDGFDIALAHKLVNQNLPVVCNDFYLKDRERILVISGPNQGGKTTFARAFGQLHYLASIGYPVPGKEAQLFLFDRIFTHFEKEEKVENLRGKLEDDLFRIRGIFNAATPRSIIIMNEIFTSTTLQDEIFLSRKIMEKISALDALCVWVTFIDELASFGPQTVSMVSTVVPENPAQRTFKIERRPADGLAYAMAIARKYRLTYDSIKERIGS